MPRVSRNLVTWSPTTQQREAARLLAACATWEYTARRVGVKSLQTIANWLAIPGFVSLRQSYEVRFDEYLEGDITGALAEMFGLWRQFVRGEVQGDDPRIPHIQPTVVKYIERFYDVAAPPAPATSAVGAQVLVNVNGAAAGHVPAF